MKSISALPVVVLFVLIGLTVQAGDKIGIRAGYQNSSFHVNGSMLENTGSLSGYYFGVFKEKQLIPLLRLG